MDFFLFDYPMLRAGTRQVVCLIGICFLSGLLGVLLFEDGEAAA